MLSNKLTFSLIFVLMFALVVGSAMGQISSADLNSDGDATSAANADMISANDFIVYTMNGGVHGIAAGVSVETAASGNANFPDIEKLLRGGGTIELVLNIGDKGTTTNTITADMQTLTGVDGTNLVYMHELSAASAEKAKHRLIISEIMWGHNRMRDATAGNPDILSAGSQWIEVYNHGAALKAMDQLYLVFHNTKMSRLGAVVPVNHDNDDGTTATINGVVVDSVSTVTDFGSVWALKGNSGNSMVIGSGNQAILPNPLTSMYRKVNLMAGVYKKTDKGALDGLGAGTEGGSWEASAGSIYMSAGFIGSPGSVHVSAGGLKHTFSKNPASISATGVIINEVRNDTSGANLDWVEFYHNDDSATATAVNLENWTLSIVTGKMMDDGTYYTSGDGNFMDENLFSLPKFKLQPDQYLVVYNRHPRRTALAGGVNVQDVIDGNQVNAGASHLYFVAPGLNLPSDKKFTLILRNDNDKKGTHEKVVDYIGNGFFKRIEMNKYNTAVWPFIGWSAPAAAGFGDNTFAGDMSWGRKTGLADNGMYRPNSRANDRGHGDDWATFGFVGTGYDRNVDMTTAPGTPGYANVAVNVIADDRDNAAMKQAYAFGGSVTISEIMYDAGPRWNLIQWIELYNSSMTETINLDGWVMEIRNKEDVESYVDSSFEFVPHTKLLPNQTLLLVSGTGANDVADNRVYNLYAHHRRSLGLLARDSVLLSRTGFYLNLKAKVAAGGSTEMMMVDEAGNVEVKGAQRNVMWELPTRDPAARQSLVRQYGTRAIDGTPDAADDGLMESSWEQSDLAGAGLSYYGHRNDIGTPGFRLGGPLPVSLSKFRPVRNQTTGHVDITWITESELNNAGFNILRAESKTGEFKVINVKGIVAGHGTTSEKHVYTFTDTTAKPNVVYYYQIEDVSINGQRTTLTTTHLRGHVGAAGKATTRWGELKSSGK